MLSRSFQRRSGVFLAVLEQTRLKNYLIQIHFVSLAVNFDLPYQKIVLETS